MAIGEQERERLGEALFRAVREVKPLPGIAKRFSDITYEDAYQIQRYMLQAYRRAGFTRAGRKIGLTSKAMRESVNIDEPDYGSIFFNSYFPSGGVLRAADYVIPRVEVEFAYKLKSDLTGRNLTREDVLTATGYIVCALELIDNRVDMDGLQIFDSIADNAAFAGYTLGDIPIPPGEADMRNVGIVVDRNGQQEVTSSGAAVMGDATNGIVWLANKMVELGEPLRAGEYVLAGSVVAAMPARAGDSFRADFGRFGAVSVRFQ